MRRRARRRLVGAIALVVFIVIMLPIVFDEEPKPISQDLVIRIPSQDSAKFSQRVLPPSEMPAEPQEAAPAQIERESARPPQIKPALKPEAVPGKAVSPQAPAKEASAKTPVAALKPPADAEARRAQAILEAESYVVPLGAYTNQANAKQLQARVAAAGFKSYTETVKGAKGEQTRVRAGPFATREAAEQAREKLKSRGWTVGAVTRQ